MQGPRPRGSPGSGPGPPDPGPGGPPTCRSAEFGTHVPLPQVAGGTRDVPGGVPGTNVGRVAGRSVPQPKNAVTAILDQEGLEQALSILTEAGVDSTSVEVLSGQEGAEILDLDGSHHGLRARLVRHIQLSGSSENDLRNYSVALQEDRVVVIVPVADEHMADAAGAVLERCGGERVLYFRTTKVERL
jgi:hypothetical protein